MFSPLSCGMAVSAMDNEKQPDKRATRLGDFFGGSDVIADFESQSPKLIRPQIDNSVDERTSDKKAKTLHKSLPDPKAAQAMKPSKKVAFADLPVIDEKPETTVVPKRHIEHKEVATSQLRDQSKSSRLAQHFEAYYKITLGRNKDIPVWRIKPAAFQENLAVLDEKQTCVLLWSLSGSDDRVPNKSEDQVDLIRKIVSKKFVKGIGGYTMSTSDEITVAYEFMPVSLAEIAASRKVRGPEMAYILKQVRHPELSCSNVLLDTSGQVKICTVTSFTYQSGILADFFTKGASTSVPMGRPIICSQDFGE
ncbi:hypothetical protein FBEOM_14502 [Fusarium beomiforme]|uniref:Protein kinase domain-containing protein n=1 Tax=Fusarium beomiforme TaxID=44412 RepID=A0A9P5A3F2_9HYPO|nr:hypothetical protein FBEOM_14502 [Fusarium beomiforme]